MYGFDHLGLVGVSLFEVHFFIEFRDNLGNVFEHFHRSKALLLALYHFEGFLAVPPQRKYCFVLVTRSLVLAQQIGIP